MSSPSELRDLNPIEYQYFDLEMQIRVAMLARRNVRELQNQLANA